MQTILPWENKELEALLQSLIALGTETAKIDFKAEIETATADQKAEFLKDITAMANTYDENNADHGFLIYGVKGKTITGITQTETDTDKLQSHIEQILKTYISPMPQIYVVGFKAATDEQWGVIVIPPRNSKPHMFFKDLQCTDPKRSRKKGEWFVRRGSTTDHGLPEDLAIITQRQTELLLEPLRESVRNLQIRFGKTEEQYNSALFKLVERAVSALPAVGDRESEDREELGTEIGEVLGMDLSARLKQKLRTPKDALAEGLVAEAKALRNFLDAASPDLPWAPRLNDAAGNKKIVEGLEEKTRSVQLSLATITLNDHDGTYTDALLRAVKILAKTLEVPSGTPYNRMGQAVRYYPLGLILYTIFVSGVAAGRADLLKQVLEIPLKRPGKKEAAHILDLFYFWYDAKALFNDAFTQTWCEPIAQRIRQVLNDRIGEMMAEFSESEFFFRGEFVLALTPIDLGTTNGLAVADRGPLPGLYLYMQEAYEVIEGLLLEQPDWLDKIYKNPLDEILGIFDQNASKAVAPNCMAIGLRGLRTAEFYGQSLQGKTKG
jgi:Putative DNA-binding domain